ncbi:MAG: PQQ-binding-like beta-propeller repeat protein [Phaeodactylibacter sp.]|nr:PQQ-binding-like beta-propeller repeat protein [Phaeodactylibacter sp.]MCB9054144.1 PQQ-binding-like beta-propeller repeat protein [Lewinellaceae bacterium]
MIRPMAAKAGTALFFELNFRIMKPPVIIFLLLSLAFSTFGQTQADATRWRGPDGNGIYPEEGLLKTWPADGPEIAWTYEGLGEGYSSPVIANGILYVTGMEDETGYVYAISEAGKLLWKSPYGPEFASSYPGARSSPTVAGDLLYMLSGQGQLVCMIAEDGTLKWSKDLFRDFDGRNIRWGVTETVVADDDKVFCTPGGSTNNIIALNRFSGNLIWSSPGKGDVSAYCTPLLIELPTRKLLVTMTADNILGLDAANGKLLWSHPQSNQYSVHANTPIYHDRAVYCFSGYGKGGVKLQLNEDGSSVTKKWFNQTLNSRIGGAVAVGGYIYGSGDSNREWQCIDWETGEQKYSTTEVGNGIAIYADGMLYWYSQRGELALAKPGPDGFQIAGKTKVTLGSGQHWAHPVINNKRLFVRHGNALIAYQIGEDL